MIQKDYNNIPIVFIHKGSIPVYLIFSALQAKKYRNEVYLITDSKIKIPGVKVVDYSLFNSDELIFKKQYKVNNLIGY